MNVIRLSGQFAAVPVVLVAVALAAPDTAVLTRVDVTAEGRQIAEAVIDSTAVTSDGRAAVFVTTAAVARGDRNRDDDVYLRDSRKGTTTRVSYAASGAGGGMRPTMTPDGRWVAFVSDAAGMVRGPANGRRHVYLRDMRTQKLEVIDTAPSGAAGNGDATPGPGDVLTISPDGRYVSFTSLATDLTPGDTNRVSDVFVRDRRTARTVMASTGKNHRPANGSSSHPSISADGRYVTFASTAGNLVAQEASGRSNVFVRDLTTGMTTLVSQARPNRGGADGDSTEPVMSDNGEVVAFTSDAENLTTGDRNNQTDVFVWHRSSGVVSLLSVGKDTRGDGPSFLPSISSDGTVVAFTSFADNLVRSDTNDVPDVFVSGLTDGLRRVSVTSTGRQADRDSLLPELSRNGHYLTFLSAADNLVRQDTNDQFDVFLRRLD